MMLVAGEASGDLHGAELAHELKKLNPQIDCFGIGGKNMRAAEVNTLIDCSELSVIGLFDVIKHIPSIFRTLKKARQMLTEYKPDLLVLIDYPGFNLRLAKTAKQLGIKVLFYISPQVWAWRQGRVRVIKRRVDHMAVIFPFEAEFYQKANVPVTYVGHPLANKVRPTLTLDEAQQTFGLDAAIPTIGLLPGSRKLEWQRLMPVILDSVKRIHAELGTVQFVLPQASTISDEMIQHYLASINLPIKVIKQQAYDAINCCDALIVCSGTATLEVALLEKPMVVIYKGAALTAMVLRRMIKIPFVALCNIVAGQQVAKELLQNDANAEKITQEIVQLLSNKDYVSKIKTHLKQVKEKLGTANGSKNVAQLINKLIL